MTVRKSILIETGGLTDTAMGVKENNMQRKDGQVCAGGPEQRHGCGYQGHGF